MACNCTGSSRFHRASTHADCQSWHPCMAARGRMHKPGFSPTTAQFLANRGYIVFEPNFRASNWIGCNYLFAAKEISETAACSVTSKRAYGSCWRRASAIRSASASPAFPSVATRPCIPPTFSLDLFRVGVAVVPPSDFVARLALGNDL